MTDVKRGLMSDPVVSRFRGLNRFINIAEIPPDSATDLLNVICSLSGGLAPLRQPQPVNVLPSTHSYSALQIPGNARPWDPTLPGNAAYIFAGGTLPDQGGGAAPVSMDVVFGQSIRITASGTFKPSRAGILALMGAFVDNSGVVKAPLQIGAKGKFVAPAGTTKIQLGVNDDRYADNSGTPWNVTVSVQGGGTWSGTVGVQSMPWDSVLNPALDQGMHDGTAPTAVALTINPGDVVTVECTGGGSMAYGGGTVTTPNGGIGGTITGTGNGASGTPFATKYTDGLYVADANGCVYDCNVYPGDVRRGKFPMEYIAGASETSAVRLGGLMGAFTDNAGNVIQPVVVGTSALLVVPVGATKLKLGVNDNRYLENDAATAFTLDVDVIVTGTTATHDLFTGTCYGFFDYQRADGIRQLISVWDTKIYVMSAVGGSWQSPVLVDDNANNAAYWSMSESSNILFMANGLRMLKWNGDKLQQWGIKKPSHIPTNPVVTNGAGGVNLATGRKYRAALKNSATGTLSSASDPSNSSGPATNATIATSIDATTDVAADPQIDTVVWYATLDDGTTYYYHSEVPVNKTGPTTLTDNDVDPSVSAPTQVSNSAQLADNGKQVALTGNNWEFITFGVPQWRRYHGPAVGAPLPTMRATQFGLNVPVNAVITGVKVEIAANAQAATTSYVSKMQLCVNGAAVGTAKTFSAGTNVIPSVPGSSTLFDFGNASDMWGLAGIDPKDANDATFGFETTIQYTQDVRVFLFNFNIWVYYSLPSSSTTQVNSQITAQLINEPPPLGKYLRSWGGRILIGGLPDNPQDVAYSGYEQILDGRPEEAFPPSNRLRISSGADQIRGIGEVQAGVLIGTRSNEMYMLRGDLEDVVVGNPLNFTEQLEPLPFDTGFASHYAIIRSAVGATYLSAQRSIDNYAGVQTPEAWSLPIANILRDIPAAMEERCIGVHYNYLDKDWYVLAIPYGVSATKPNLIIVVDMEMNSQNNTGIFLFDVGAFDAMNIIEEPSSGRPMLMIAQGGEMLEVNVVVKGTNGLQIADTADAVPVAQPFWTSGWWGGDSAQTSKMFRHAYCVSDGGVAGTNDFSLEASLVDDRAHKFRNPLVVVMAALRDQIKGTINKKSKRCKVKVKFPTGIAATVQQLWTSYITTGER